MVLVYIYIYIYISSTEEVNGSHSCDPNFTICNETSTDMNWRMVCTIATSVLLAILLVLALPIVIICVYRYKYTSIIIHHNSAI